MLLRMALAASVAIGAAVGSASAPAQVQRAFPQNALRGTLVVGDPPEVALNGRPARLAPGARIRNQAGMVEMSGSLVGARLLVHYTLDPLQLVKEVWILTPEEAARRPWPTTPQQAQDWIFDADAQTWTRP